ncbi:MAG: hypothetical protein JSR80_03020 [Verrucomicrobia bacterium]|nr:hypothetical protein [Verrucomicrobiota bacterium]
MQLIGDYKPEFEVLPGAKFEELLSALQKAAEPCFLLPRLLKALGALGRRFEEFESWLDQQSLTFEENRRLRGKIAGRFLPREEYQFFFPVGGAKRYKGPHIVTAHASPDLDTAVASFWGWLDAFAARITLDRHEWNFPGGVPTPQIERLFNSAFGENFFSTLPTSHLQLQGFGTVSLRDFCNREEVKIGPDLQVISVVDHHRASLQTIKPATCILGDVASCNTLVAEVQFRMNDRYERPRGLFFVAKERCQLEYWMLLHAIIDDTDLLERVTLRDVEVTAELINRLKGEEVAVIDATHPFEAAKALLKSPDLHSLYSKIYHVREAEVLRDLQAAATGKRSYLFADTKEQKGKARVGQAKLFSCNFPHFAENAHLLRSHWATEAEAIYHKRPHLNLHMQMISTIAGADEVYRGKQGEYDHQDELWMWVAPTDEGQQQLEHYLSNFTSSPEVSTLPIHVDLIGPKLDRLQATFAKHFKEVRLKPSKELKTPIAVLRFSAGKITSRKANITPHL